MEHFRLAVNRLIDLSERDERSTPETIDTLVYYFSCINPDRVFKVVPKATPVKKKENEL